MSSTIELFSCFLNYLRLRASQLRLNGSHITLHRLQLMNLLRLRENRLENNASEGSNSVFYKWALLDTLVITVVTKILSAQQRTCIC
jgi:hypothetical protein